MKFKVDKVSGPKKVLALVTDEGGTIAIRGKGDEALMISGISSCIYAGVLIFQNG